MIDPFAVAQGAMEVALTDIRLGDASTLLAVCNAYGVDLSDDLSETFAEEYAQLALYERGDIPLGLTMEFVPEPVGQTFPFVPGPGSLANYGVTIRVLWRDPVEKRLKLSESPQVRQQFLSAFTTALLALFNPVTLAPTGLWAFGDGLTALGPQINEIDTGADVTQRSEVTFCTENVLNCFSYG